MRTPDIDYDKALGVVAPRFKLLEKTEDDVVWAALPKLDQEVLTQLKDHDEFEPGLVKMTKALGDMQKEAGKFLAGWHEAQERVKTAKELLDGYNLAQTVDTYGEQLATHGDLHAAHVAQFAEHETFISGQKTFNAEQNTTNAFVKKELDARKQDKNDLKIRMRNVEGDVREQKGKEAIVERVLTFNKETKEEELQRSLAENKELRKKAERLAAVEAEKEMLEKLLDDLALVRDTNKKDLADADKAIAAQGTTIATLESKLTQKEDAIALVAAKDKEIEKMKEARAKEKIDEANEKMNLRRQSAERAKTKATALEDKLDTVKAENDALRRDLAAKDKSLAELAEAQVKATALAEKLDAAAVAEAALRRDYDTLTAEARQSVARLETTRAELKAREEKSDEARCASEAAGAKAATEREKLRVKLEASRAKCATLESELKAAAARAAQPEQPEQVDEPTPSVRKPRMGVLSARRNSRKLSLKAPLPGPLRDANTENQGPAAAAEPERSAAVKELRGEQDAAAGAAFAAVLAENDSNAAALSIKVADLRRANLKIEEQGRALEAKEKELEAHGERAKEQEDRLQMYSRQGDANKKCEDQARQIVKMDEALAEAAVKIQNLYRKYLDASGALEVVIRIKKTTGDADDPAVSALKPMSDGQQVVLATADGSKLFEFDRVLGPDADQKIAYDQVAPFVASALDLHNDALVMAYGGTGAGKTFTMQGDASGAGRGIVPRAVEQIGAYCVQRATAGWDYEMIVQYVEIYYNDVLWDLLVPRRNADYGRSKALSSLGIRRHSETKRLYVEGATQISVDPTDADAVQNLLAAAAPRRSVASTNTNDVSSRSHAVLVLLLKGTNEVLGEVVHSTLTLVDLAGSERVEKSGVVGEQLKEAGGISRSLSALTNVFDALVDKRSHVPFRNSKLTYLLTDALSHGKALVLTNVSPEPEFAAETEKSLLFAQRVKKVELGKARRDVKYKGSGTAVGAKRTASRGGRRA